MLSRISITLLGIVFALLPAQAAFTSIAVTNEPTPAIQKHDDPQALSVKVETVTFLEADSAEVSDGENGKKLIFTKGLSDKVRYAAQITIEGSPADWIEAHDVAKPFPPKIIKASKPGVYRIEGQPGQTWFVSIRTAAGPPEWIEATIKGGTPPVVTPPPTTNPPPAAGEFDGIKAKAIELSKKLADKPTAEKLGKALLAIDFSGDLPALQKRVADVRIKVFEERQGFNGSWDDFDSGIAAEMAGLKIVDPVRFKGAITAIAQGLIESAK